jgi:hypothetical protein
MRSLIVATRTLSRIAGGAATSGDPPPPDAHPIATPPINEGNQRRNVSIERPWERL